MLALCMLASSAQMPAMPPGMLEALPKKPKSAPLDADVPYIKCDTCKALASHLYDEVGKLVAAQAPMAAKKRRLESRSNLGSLEEEVESVLTNVCNTEDKDGKWIRGFDIMKAGRAITLKAMPPGKCRRECKTVEKACSSVLSVLEDHDVGEMLIEAVREDTGKEAVAKRMCTKMATVCKKGKTPLYPEGKVRKNEEFIPMTEQDIKDEKMMGKPAPTLKEFLKDVQPHSVRRPSPLRALLALPSSRLVLAPSVTALFTSSPRTSRGHATDQGRKRPPYDGDQRWRHRHGGLRGFWKEGSQGRAEG